MSTILVWPLRSAVTEFLSGLPVTASYPISTLMAPSSVHPRRMESSAASRVRGLANCFYNYEVTSFLDTVDGGTLTVNIISHGVLSSACPHISPKGGRDPVYVRYVLSTERIATPAPSMAPTIGATKGGNIYNNNGLNVEFGKVDFLVAMQISFAIAVLFAAFGIALSKVTEHTECRAYQHRIIKAAIEMGLLGADITNFVFLLLELMKSGFMYYAYALCAIRFIGSVVAIGILSAVYGSKKYQERSSFAHLLDRKHMLNGPNANIYALCSFLAALDLQILAYLPWFNSPFSRMSKGYPANMIFRVVSITTLCSTFSFIGLQIPTCCTTVATPWTRLLGVEHRL